MGRVQLAIALRKPKFRVASTQNIPPFFSHPISAGKIYQPDLYRYGPDGEPKVTLADVCDANEILMIDAENQHRAEREAEERARRNSRGARSRGKR